MGKTKTSQVSGITYHKNHVLNKEYKHNIRNVFVATSQAAPPAQFGRFCCFLIVRGSTQQGKQGAKPSGKKGEHPGDLRGPLKLTLDFQENTPVEYVEVLWTCENVAFLLQRFYTYTPKFLKKQKTHEIYFWDEISMRFWGDQSWVASSWCFGMFQSPRCRFPDFRLISEFCGHTSSFLDTTTGL